MKNGQARITTSRWHTTNGYGSSSTVIVKYTTELDASDDIVATIVNSATLGFVITANMNCKITCIFGTRNSAISSIGVSLNSTELTNSITGINVADRLIVNTQQTSNQPTETMYSWIFKKGDVLRIHGDGNAAGTTLDNTSITVKAEEII